MRRRSGGVRFTSRAPRYDPKLWNQFEAVINGEARTNNISEGWHNKFQLVVGKHHPSLYVFFDELKKEQADTEVMMRQLQLGQRIRKGIERKRRQYEEQLHVVVQKYYEHVYNNNVLAYLKNVGYYVKL